MNQPSPILNDLIPQDILVRLCMGNVVIEASLKDEYCPEEWYKNKWARAYYRPIEGDFKRFNFRIKEYAEKT